MGEAEKRFRELVRVRMAYLHAMEAWDAREPDAAGANSVREYVEYLRAEIGRTKDEERQWAKRQGDYLKSRCSVAEERAAAAEKVCEATRTPWEDQSGSYCRLCGGVHGLRHEDGCALAEWEEGRDLD